MYRWILLILLMLWVCMLVIAGVNLYRHYQVSKLNNRILQDYKDMSSLDKIFKSIHDSLQTDIAICDSVKANIDKPFPLPGKNLNWLLIRILVASLTILSIITVWLYYKKRASE